MQTFDFFQALKSLDAVLLFLQNQALTPAELRVLVFVAQKQQLEQTLVRISRPELAAHLGANDSAVKRIWGGLEKRGLVVSHQPHRAPKQVGLRGLTDAGLALLDQASQLMPSGEGREATSDWTFPMTDDAAALDAIDLAALGIAAPTDAGAEPDLVTIDPSIAQLAINPDDAMTVCRAFVKRTQAMVDREIPRERFPQLVAEMLWSVLCGSTSYKGWSVQRRVNSVASLVRAGRWGTPNRLPKNWHAIVRPLMSIHLPVPSGSLSVH